MRISKSDEKCMSMPLFLPLLLLLRSLSLRFYPFFPCCCLFDSRNEKYRTRMNNSFVRPFIIQIEKKSVQSRVKNLSEAEEVKSRFEAFREPDYINRQLDDRPRKFVFAVLPINQPNNFALFMWFIYYFAAHEQLFAWKCSQLYFLMLIIYSLFLKSSFTWFKIWNKWNLAMFCAHYRKIK